MRRRRICFTVFSHDWCSKSLRKCYFCSDLFIFYGWQRLSAFFQCCPSLATTTHWLIKRSNASTNTTLFPPEHWCVFQFISLFKFAPKWSVHETDNLSVRPSTQQLRPPQLYWKLFSDLWKPFSADWQKNPGRTRTWPGCRAFTLFHLTPHRYKDV